ncbi:hypothetical protein G9U53_19540 [Rhodococcus sp. D-46]|uniref:Uncharacterized protein n=2 Tax=Rhodococcus erythropolis group TaxID=2840174 RepID=A0A5P3GDE1_RHOER|nr:hypothetical protein A0W34_22295 [Rhodococcus sp. BH4]AUS33744.1 hypothetical protein C1M55_23360 [Rhodococcus qingshengii]AZI63717.1 hypothetical protein EHW12_23050 [Rhodococcus sp. NJ-530]EME17796.1 hypothetical protein G418_21684 [Rhodococcus qingshengii BKS 20-40]KPH15762.1 hypothetical protein AN948_31995 [Rhodococcus sp. ADH]KZF11926.1 hypothetical protein A2J01_17365 [Rhodococcus sp. EPR-134]MBW0283258.1 hypothetical protein [Rhodococcus sp. FH8]MCE4160984.1 hypothetical protein [
MPASTDTLVHLHETFNLFKSRNRGTDARSRGYAAGMTLASLCVLDEHARQSGILLSDLPQKENQPS